MMELGDLLTRDGVLASLRAQNKKQALQEMSAHAARLTGLEQRDLYEHMLQREKLGSTGLGRGIAIPHIRCRGIDRVICAFARLADPIPFEAIDGDPVDLMFLLISPEHASGDHLKALARISRILREPAHIERLRAARDAAAIYAILTTPVTSHAA
jgi:PTS system nitrogen regulatory IIA component